LSSERSVPQGEAGVLVHFQANAAKARPYLRPFAGLEHAAAGGESNTVLDAGVGLGVKVPITTWSRFALRLEGAYAPGFKKESSGIGASDAIQVLIGLSMFTR
jgi:hypothetical protein